MLSNVVVTFVTKWDTYNVIVYLGKCSSNGGSNRLVRNSLSSLHQKTDATDTSKVILVLSNTLIYLILQKMMCKML